MPGGTVSRHAEMGLLGDEAGAENPPGYSLPDMAYGKIISDVIDGRFPVNSRLPSENALAGEIGVSRPVLRMALGRLKIDGIIASRRGSGNFVIRRPHPSVLLFAEPIGIGEVQNGFKFRVGIEGEAAYYAAFNHDSANRAAIEAALDALQQVQQTREPGVKEDFALHMRIAEASDNPYFVAALEAVRKQTSFGISITRHLSLRRSEERLKQVDEEHGEICARIFARDGEGARTAMRAHLESARRRLFDSDLVMPGATTARDAARRVEDKS